MHQSCERFLSLDTEWVAVFLWYLSFQLIDVRKGVEGQELKQRHCLIGQLIIQKKLLLGGLLCVSSQS